MPELHLSQVITSARKLTLAYMRANRSLSTPVALDPTTRKGWYNESSRPQGLIRTAENLLGIKIEVKKMQPLGLNNPISAFVKNYGERAEIFVSSAQNYCWQRFLIAKELAHLLIRNEGNQTPIENNEVQSLLSSLINSVEIGENPILQAELSAYFAAIEMLLPMEHVNTAKEAIDRGESIHDVAQTFRIPRNVIEYRLTDPSAQALFNQAYSTHKYQNAEFSALL